MSNSHISYTPDWYPHQSVSRPPSMTLREYYAGLAMQAAISNDVLLQRIDDGDRGAMQFCVEWSDALIAELQREDDDE